MIKIKKKHLKKLKKKSFIVQSILVFGFALVLLAFFENRFIIHANKFITPKAIAQENLKLRISLTPTPSASPSPTLTPAPVYQGFCMNVPVLMYHHIDTWEHAKQMGHTALTVDSGVFDQQMGYLAAQGYTFYFAEDLVNALRSHSSLSGKPVVITIDDGYEDVYSYAYPVLKKYNAKATVFVPTGLLGNTSGPNSYYSWNQLKDMTGSGLVEAENHTWSHFPMGTQGPDKDQYEMTTAENQIQQNLGRHSNVFAYPYGTNAGSIFVESEVQKDGFNGAFSTIGGTYQCDSFIYSLHRVRIGTINFPAFGIY